MTPEQIKTKVKEAFSGVDSEEFLQEQIKIGIQKHRKNYEIFKENNPEKDFIFWKTKNEEININQNIYILKSKDGQLGFENEDKICAFVFP